MKELNLSVYTSRDGESKVTMTSLFDTHGEAVAFHDDLAAVCNKHSKGMSPANQVRAGVLLPWNRK